MRKTGREAIERYVNKRRKKWFQYNILIINDFKEFPMLKAKKRGKADYAYNDINVERISGIDALAVC